LLGELEDELAGSPPDEPVAPCALLEAKRFADAVGIERARQSLNALSRLGP
jgi:hypothetical protein